MAITALPPRRVIIVGAGASQPYALPLAGRLLTDAVKTIGNIEKRYDQLTTGMGPYNASNARTLIGREDPICGAVLNAIEDPLTPKLVATTFRESLVQQNLDDFVRDHPSLTSVVATLISASLFSSLYKKEKYDWELRSQFRLAGMPLEKDWMRRFVGIVRPLASTNNRLTIISFNYDGLLERSMSMYWPGAETLYAKLNESVSFIYPHGRFTELPNKVSEIEHFIRLQAAQLRVGGNRDEVARKSAKEAIQRATRIFSVGFSCSDNNLKLLGFNYERASIAYVQNYNNQDVRLTRKLNAWDHEIQQREDGDMDALVTNGFFEQ